MKKLSKSKKLSLLSRIVVLILSSCYWGIGYISAVNSATIKIVTFVNGERSFFTCNRIDEANKEVWINGYTERIIGKLDIPREVTLYKEEVWDSGITKITENLGDFTVVGVTGLRNQSLLSEVSFPETIKTIGGDAFSACTNLREVTIGSGVEIIGDEAFRWCALSKITLNDGLKSIGYRAFAQGIIEENRGNLKEIVIPNSVIEIGDYAFSHCYNLKKIVLGSSLKNIKESAFYDSHYLESITILSSNPPTLGNQVFSDNLSKSTNLYIPTGSYNLYYNIEPWQNYNIIDDAIPTDFIVEINGEPGNNIFAQGLTMVEGERKEFVLKTNPYIEDLEVYGISDNFSACPTKDYVSCKNAIMIYALEAGTATVTIGSRYIDKSKSFVLTVHPKPVVQPEKIILSNSVLSLKKGESESINVTVLPETTTDKTITWESSDEAIVTVDAKGKVTAVAVGNAVITATCGDVSVTCNVTVVKTDAGSITLDKSELELKATETAQLTATVLPETTTDKTLTWKSSNEQVATVDANGKVTAVAVGKANITGTAASGISATCEVTVVPAPAASVTLNRSELSMKAS